MMSKPYRYMTPEEQRTVDERDLEIIKRRARGETYRAIREAIGVTDPVIKKVWDAYIRG